MSCRNALDMRSKPVPKSWKDLLNPTYKGMVGYLDPASAFVGYVGAVALQEDGKIIIGGSFTAVNEVPRVNLARLNPNGSVDLTWNPPSPNSPISCLGAKTHCRPRRFMPLWQRVRSSGWWRRAARST